MLCNAFFNNGRTVGERHISKQKRNLLETLKAQVYEELGFEHYLFLT